MENLKITANEKRALGEFLLTNPCTMGCAYPEMKNSKKDCEDCELTKARHSLLEKLGLN